ncbi:zinc-ribbon domain-containing protein [Butyrivibrio sp. WCE2006]|uniref:zinc-ribbon domain-containing protein n=1 Tax=Butyrivibrio sp. WCE2006 TaxID=1410611 RepID=UPI0018CBFF16|nr:zinc-ribbon domain-containing protein [Butyrivibrio sp. WCE2006]
MGKQGEEADNLHWYSNEKLRSEWDVDANIGVSPCDLSNNSHKEAHWKCCRGHKWQEEVRKRATRGYGCPYCSGKRVIVGETDLVTKAPKLAKEWHPTMNGDLKPSQFSLHSNKNVVWLCPKGHAYKAMINDRSRGKGCPYCAGKKPIIGETDLEHNYPELILEWDFDKNKRLPNEYTCGSHKKVYWICPKGHEYIACIKDRVRGNGCSKCAHRKVSTGETDLQSNFPEIAEQWNYKRNKTTPDKVFSHSNKEYWWICDKGHEWKAVVYSRTGKNKNGCPICSGWMVDRGRTDFFTVYPELLHMWNDQRNRKRPSDVTAHSNIKVYWKCENGHEWRTSVDKISGGTGCPYCHRMQISSKKLD